MRISLLSDVHAEFYDDNWLPPLPDNPDVLVLAGDTHVGKRLVTFVEKIGAALPSTRIIFVAGNHEFYRQYRGRTLESYRRAFFGHKKIHFLENSFVELEGVRFIGATMWTGFPLHTMNFNEREVLAYVRGNVTDFNVIAEERSKFKTFTPSMVRGLFFESKCAIELMIKESQVRNTVVVTHFPPITQLIHPGFKVSEVTSYFTSDCLSIIEEHQPDFWFYGHNHWADAVRIGKTNIVSNQFCYPDERNKTNCDFDSNLILTL